MEIYGRLQNHKWFLSGLAVLCFVVLINRFPAGYIILGGDVLQNIHLSENYKNLSYEWLGRASLFYGIFYFLDVLGVTATAQLSWYLGIFLFGEYLSFALFARLIFPRAAKWLKAGLALFYATNIYTLYIFTSTWGFTNYQILYVFIPAFTGLYISALRDQGYKFAYAFLLLTALASMSFGNPAFALSLGIYFFLLTIALFVSRFIHCDRDGMKKIAFLAIGAFLLNAYWILPLVPQVRSGIYEVSVSSDIVLSEALAKTSNAIFDTMRLVTTSEQKIYYPYNFPYPSLSFAKEGVAFLTFIPFFIVLFGLVYRKSGEQKTLYFIFFSLFVVFVVLVARVRFPFDSFNAIFFQWPGFNVLRGWDKMAIFTPFLLSALLLVFFAIQEGKKYAKVMFIGFGIVAFLLALPFYAGGIQTKMSYILAGSKKKDFNIADHSALVKIPDPYYAVAEVFKRDTAEDKISMLPFSPGSSIGRVDLPKWKVNGPHPANALYTKKYLELNDYYVGKWIFGREFNRREYNPQWIADLYGLIGIKYVFYHYDAKPKSLDKFEPARKYLEEKGVLQPVETNKWFTLYRMDKQYLFPYVYANPEAMLMEPNLDGLSEKIRNFRNQMTPLPYQRKNPKEIIVAMNAMTSQWIFLNEKYDPLWRAKYITPEGKSLVLERNDDVKYANAWKIDEGLKGGKIDIYYMPLRLFYMGMWVSGVALLGVTLGLVYVRRKTYNKM